MYLFTVVSYLKDFLWLYTIYIWGLVPFFHLSTTNMCSYPPLYHLDYMLCYKYLAKIVPLEGWHLEVEIKKSWPYLWIYSTIWPQRFNISFHQYLHISTQNPSCIFQDVSLWLTWSWLWTWNVSVLLNQLLTGCDGGWMSAWAPSARDIT